MLEEFDFESNNSRFDKEKLLEEVAKTDSNDDKSRAYDKTSSFFDNISCEATDRMKDDGSRRALAEQRKKDVETFGGYARNQDGNYQHHYQHQYQHSYRGGRGRGGNRFNNNNSGERQYNNNNRQSSPTTSSSSGPTTRVFRPVNQSNERRFQNNKPDQ